MAEPVKLLIPTALEFVAKRLIESVLESGSPNNDINTLKDSLQIVIDPWLTSSTAHYITTSMNDDKYGLILQRRAEPKINQFSDDHTTNVFFSIKSRMGTGYVTAFSVVGNQGA